MNTTIGYWTDESQKIKSQLVEFMLGEMAKKIPQIGSLEYTTQWKDHPRLWEYATAIECSNPHNTDSILDVGGLNNLLGWYLHNKLGCGITQIGLNKQDATNHNKNNPDHRKVSMLPICADIRDLKYKEDFDIVYCINVIEHVREHARKNKPPRNWQHGRSAYWGRFLDANWTYEEEQERLFVEALAKAIVSDGLLVITFDFNNHGGWKRQNKCAYMRNTDDIMERIVEPSGLKIVGEVDYDTTYAVTCNRPSSTGIIVLKK